MTFATMAAFVAASLALSFTPGPDILFVLTQSAMHGWRRGVVITAGLCSGLIVHTAAVALGVAVIFKQSEAAFTALKFVGAAYLLHLAYGAFRAGATLAAAKENTPHSYGRVFLRGVIMNVSNPKVALFCLALLPQFTDPDLGAVEAQIAVLGALLMGSVFCAFSLTAILAGTLSQRLLKSEGAQMILNRTAGTIFIALAAKLALAER